MGPRTMRPWGASGIGVLLAFFSTNAAAAPRPWPLREAVHVQPGVTCVEEPVLRDQIRTWLDADSVDGDLRVEVEGSRRDARAVSFRMWRGHRLLASRRFEPGPADCAQMHAVLGLAIALALKVSLRDELFGELASRPDEERWALGAGATAAWDVLPGGAWGATVWFEKALPEHFAAHLEFSGLAGSSETFERVQGKFSTASVALGFSLCAVPVLGARVRGRLCAGLEARRLLASGSGFTLSKDAGVGWLAVSNSAGVSVRVSPTWSLVGAVGLVLPMEKTQIAVTDATGHVVDSRDSAAVGGSITVGAAYEF